MDFRGALAVLWRRRVLTATLLLLTLGASAGVGVMLPWSYSASITEVLLNSTITSKALGGGNPYLAFDAPLVQTANVLAIKIGAPANLAALQAKGDTASVQAQVLSENAQTEEPFIQVTVTGKSKQAVLQTLQDVSANMNSILEKLQSGVPVGARTSLQTLAADSSPARQTSGKLKPLIAVFAVGLLLTFLVPQAVEGSAARRRERGRRTDPQPVPDDSYGAPFEDDSTAFRSDQANGYPDQATGYRGEDQANGYRGEDYAAGYRGEGYQEFRTNRQADGITRQYGSPERPGSRGAKRPEFMPNSGNGH